MSFTKKDNSSSGGQAATYLPDHIGTDDATAPVPHSSSCQGYSDENHRNGGNERRKQGHQYLGREAGKKELKQAAHHARSKHPVVQRRKSVSRDQRGHEEPMDPLPYLLSVRVKSIDAIVLHLLDGNLKDRKEREAGSHDTEDSGTNIELAPSPFRREGDRDLGDVDKTADSTGDQGGRNGILLGGNVKKADGEAKDDERRRDETAHHGKGMLEAHNGGKEDGKLLI